MYEHVIETCYPVGGDIKSVGGAAMMFLAEIGFEVYKDKYAEVSEHYGEDLSYAKISKVVYQPAGYWLILVDAKTVTEKSLFFAIVLNNDGSTSIDYLGS
jgi:hypothetical protein